MSTFSSVSGAQLIKALRKLGFEVIRIKGSHHFLRHADGRGTVVPVHQCSDGLPLFARTRVTGDEDSRRDQVDRK